jgi:hypothetical protein
MEKDFSLLVLKTLEKEMPLILLTGLPSSGKSRRAQQISDYCKQRCLDEKLSMEVMLIRDETLHSGKTVYDCMHTDTRPDQCSRIRGKDGTWGYAVRYRT